MKDSENLEEHGKKLRSRQRQSGSRTQERRRRNDNAGRNQKCHNAEAALFAAKPGLGGARIGTLFTPTRILALGESDTGQWSSLANFWSNNVGRSGPIWVCMVCCVCACVGVGFTVWLWVVVSRCVGVGLAVWLLPSPGPSRSPQDRRSPLHLTLSSPLDRPSLFFLPPGLCRELVAAVQGCGCPMGVWASLWSFCAKNVMCGGRGNNVRNSGPPLLD